MGSRKQSVVDYCKAIQINPYYADAYFNRATSFSFIQELYKKKLEDQRNLFMIFLEQLILIHQMMTRIVLKGLERQEETLCDFNKEIEMNPQITDAYLKRAIIFKGLERLEEALSNYYKYIEINPIKADANLNKAIIFKGLERLEEALSDHNKAIEIKPQNAYAYLNRGIVFDKLGRRADAFLDYKKAIPKIYTLIIKKVIILQTFQGFILNSLGRKLEAIQDFTKVIEITPQFYHAYCQRGMILNTLGNNEEELIDFSKAIDINPLNPDAYNNRGNVFNDLGRKEEGIIDFQKANQIESQGQQPQIQNRIYSFEKQSLILQGQTFDDTFKNFKDSQFHPKVQFTGQQNQDIIQNDNIQMETRQQKINQKINKLQLNKNRYIYYQSLYWKIFTYISVSLQVSDQLLSNTNSHEVIDNRNEKVNLITQIAVQEISETHGSISTVKAVIKTISTALEFTLSEQGEFKFEEIIRKLAQIVQVICQSKNQINQCIQISLIKQSKYFPVISQDQQLLQQSLLEYVIQIQKTEVDSGNEMAKNPHWRQGIVDSLKILQYLLINHQQIQLEPQKELHVVILDLLKANHIQFVKTSSRCCQIS